MKSKTNRTKTKQIKQMERRDKESRLVAARGRRWGMGKTDEGGQRVQTSRYKINKSRGSICSMVTIVNGLKVAKRVDLKHSHHRK